MRFRATLKPNTSLIDLTPLVDVIFLMLIFFIVTSDVLPLKSLNIENPKIIGDAAPLTTQLLVVMDAQNVIYVGSKKHIVDQSSVKETLQEEIAQLTKQHKGIKPTVVLSVDRRVPYEVFLRLFATVQESSARVRLVYQPDEEQNEEF